MTTKASNYVVINETVKRFSPGGDPRWMFAFADRESAFKHAAKARSEADASGARRAWKTQRQKFVDHGNPHVEEIEQDWLTSWGLYQLMTPYHLQRWSWKAHPHVLTNPITATVMAGRLFNRGKQRGAENIVDIRQMWGTGSPNRVEPGWSKRKVSLQNRFKKLGFPDDAWDWPLDRWGMQGFGLKETDAQGAQYRELAKLYNLPRNPDARVAPDWTIQDGGDPDPPDPGPDDDGLWTAETGRVLIVAGAAALGAGLLWGMRKRRR